MDLYKLIEKVLEDEGTSPMLGSGEEQLEMKSLGQGNIRACCLTNTLDVDVSKLWS